MPPKRLELGSLAAAGGGLAKAGGNVNGLHLLTAAFQETFAPNERHWHGTAPGNTMVHLTMQEAHDNGVRFTWLEHVTDAEYQGK